MRSLLLLFATLLVATAPLSAFAADSQSTAVVVDDDCGATGERTPGLGDPEPYAPDHIDLCSVSYTATVDADDAMTLELSLTVVGDVSEDLTKYGWEWTLPDGCAAHLSVRDDSTVPGGARALLSHDCDHVYQMLTAPSFEADTCVSIDEEPTPFSETDGFTCVGRNHNAIEVPADTIAGEGSTLTVTLDVNGLLPEDVAERYVPGATLDELFVESVVRAGPHTRRFHAQPEDSRACILGDCFRWMEFNHDQVFIAETLTLPMRTDT